MSECMYCGRDGAEFVDLDGDAICGECSEPIGKRYEMCGLHGYDFNDDCGWCWIERSSAPA